MVVERARAAAAVQEVLGNIGVQSLKRGIGEAVSAVQAWLVPPLVLLLRPATWSLRAGLVARLVSLLFNEAAHCISGWIQQSRFYIIMGAGGY